MNLLLFSSKLFLLNLILDWVTDTTSKTKPKSCIFPAWIIFFLKTFSLCRPLRRHWYQKMWNFIAHLLVYVKSLPEDAHQLKRLHKMLKVDFWGSVLRQLVRVWYHWKWVLELYNLSYQDSSFIYWVPKS